MYPHPMSTNKRIAVCYWGLPRSIPLILDTQTKYVYDVLKQHGVEWDVYVHLWLTSENKVWETQLQTGLDYGSMVLLRPTAYQLDVQTEFLDKLDMKKYYYEHEKEQEWNYELIKNHLCALESQKRCVNLCLQQNKSYDAVVFLRPDALVQSPIPILEILDTLKSHPNAIVLPTNNHYEGYNDRFAVMRLNHALHYSHRINAIAEFRQHHGRIVSEKYVKYVVEQWYEPVFMDFYFRLMRSDGTTV